MPSLRKNCSLGEGYYLEGQGLSLSSHLAECAVGWQELQHTQAHSVPNLGHLSETRQKAPGVCPVALSSPSETNAALGACISCPEELQASACVWAHTHESECVC